MLQYQFLCDIKQALNFREVRVLTDFQVLNVMWSKMDGGFHRWNHKHYPLPISIHLSSLLPLRTLSIRNFFGRKLKILVMYWWFVNFIFWNSVLGVAACTSFLVPVEREASSWLCCFQESELWAYTPVVPLENVRLLDFEWSVQVSLCELDHLVLHRCSPDWLDIPSFVKEFPSRSTGCAKPSWLVSPSLEPLVWASPLVNLQWKSLLASSLTLRSAFRLNQKENCWNGCKRTLRNSWCWTYREDDSIRHAKFLLVRMSASWFLV